MPDPADQPAAALAASLAELAANLDMHIADGAAQIAGPAIADAREDAERRVTDLEVAHAVNRQRWTDLEAELRRHIRSLERQRDELRTRAGETAGETVRCGARLAGHPDVDPCIKPAGHEARTDVRGPEWHSDGRRKWESVAVVLPEPSEVRIEWAVWLRGTGEEDAIRFDVAQFPTPDAAHETAGKLLVAGQYGVRWYSLMRREHHVWPVGSTFAAATTDWVADSHHGPGRPEHLATRE